MEKPPTGLGVKRNFGFHKVFPVGKTGQSIYLIGYNIKGSQAVFWDEVVL